MNQADRKEFELIHNKIDNIKSDISEMKTEMSKAHDKTEESLRFMKENLFNPHEDFGLKQNKILSSEKIHKNGEVSSE